jgi:hypothetical protein
MNEKLERRISACVAKLPPAVSGQHGHNAAFHAAAVLVQGFALSQQQAWPFILQYNLSCTPPWAERDLRKKLRDAELRPDPQQRPRGYMLANGLSGLPLPAAQPLPPRAPSWPKPDLEAIDTIVRSGPGLYDLRELSPIRFEDERSHAEEIIDVLFPGNPLLCCAKSSETFATRRREVWRGRLSTLPLMVPNPQLKPKAPTQDGRLSEHTKAATGQPVYLCIEFDFTEKARDALTDTVWAPLVRDWKANAMNIQDVCAALIFHLRERLPTLAAVSFSGGKSLHAWFRILGLEQQARRLFMEYAVARGADRATWNKAQFVRIPDGLRQPHIRQTCYYLDPEQAVRA